MALRHVLVDLSQLHDWPQFMQFWHSNLASDRANVADEVIASMGKQRVLPASVKKYCGVSMGRRDGAEISRQRCGQAFDGRSRASRLADSPATRPLDVQAR
jgi:hypothetical protein